MLGVVDPLSNEHKSLVSNCQLAQQQLNGTMPGAGRRYWLVGLLGAPSLLIMALLGFVFASRFRGHENAKLEYLSAT